MTNTALAAGPAARFRADVLAGLSRRRKRLPAKYFYDAAGSRLFDAITELPEYYPTRTELGILRVHGGEMAARCGPRCLLVELGAGSLTKVRLLLDRLDRPAGYVPVDVSADHLRSAAAALADDYPALDVVPVAADFTRAFGLPDLPAARRVVFFPGSTIGNFDPPEADALLRRVARLVGPGGGLLLGIDLRKDVAVLERAYNDAAGVTAAFNRNLLVRINRELGGDFDLEGFAHRAVWNRHASRVEMHLVSTRAQRVFIAQIDLAITFREGEHIWTESSYKFVPGTVAARLSEAGFTPREQWVDREAQFSLTLAEV
jgi:L-histidine N-alpha-methyltransferase